MEELKTIVAEKKHFEYRNKSKSIALSGNVYYQDNHARHKSTVFLKGVRFDKKKDSD